MRVGTVCYATDQGLGYLAKMYYDAGLVTHPVVVHHGRRPTHLNWYPDCLQWTDLKSGRQTKSVRDQLETMDLVLFFETPFDWSLVQFCKDRGVKTVLMPMYECMPRDLPAVPDVILCPSKLDFKYYVRSCPDDRDIEPFAKYDSGLAGASCYFTPVPADPAVKFRQRQRAEVFVHNAGHGGLMGRNGTAELMEALAKVKSPATVIVRSQERLRFGWNNTDTPDGKFKLRGGEVVMDNRTGTFPREELYAEGDVFVFPDKFNGLSLPLQEAHAAGMVVMATNRFPANDWLPKAPLVPQAGARASRVSPRCNDFVEAVVRPEDVARQIDAWYGRDVSDLSLAGRLWAERNSWEKLKPRYVRLFEEVLGR